MQKVFKFFSIKNLHFTTGTAIDLYIKFNFVQIENLRG